MAIVDASLTPIYQRLNGVDESHPYEAKTFSDWSMEAGDMVKIKRGSDEYSSPVHNLRLIWTGAPQATVSSGGKKNRAPVATQAKRNYGRGGSGLRSAEGLGHRIEETDEHWQSMYWDGYNGLSSRIEQTATYWQAEFNNMYDGLRGFVEITAEHWETEFQNAYAGLVGYVEVTAKGWHSEFQNAYTGMIGYVDATAEHWETVIDNTASELRGSIKVTSDTVKTVVEGTGSRAYIKPAAIKASIDADTGSLIELSASRIKLDGNTYLSGKLTIDNGDLKVSGNELLDGNLTVRGLNGAGNGNVSSTNYTVYAGGSITFNGASQGQTWTLSSTELVGLIKAVQITPVSGTSEYKLQYKSFTSDDWVDAGSFSRATSLTGGWESGKFTVNASPQSQSYWTEITQGAASWEDNTATVPVMATDSTSGGHSYETGRNITVNASNIYENGYKGAHLSSSWNAADTTLSVTKVTTGNVNSMSFTIGAAVTQTYDSNSHTYTATGQAKVDDVIHGSAATVKSGTEAFEAGSIAGYTGAHLSSSWNAADTTLSITKVTTGSTNSMSFAIGANAGISYNSSTHTYTATGQATVDGTVHGTAASAVSGTEAFEAGSTAGYTGAHLSSSWNAADTMLSITKVTTGSTNSMSFAIGASAGISYNSSAHTYTAIGQAKVDNVVHGNAATAVSGTEAFNDGWDHGLSLKSRDTRAATSQDTTDKLLQSSERFTIVDTYQRSNGTSDVVKYTVEAPQSGGSTVTTEWQQYNPDQSGNPYNKYVVLKDNNPVPVAYTVVMPTVSISYNSSTHKYEATGGVVADSAVRGTITTESGTEAFEAGYTGAHLSSSWNSADTTLSITKVSTGNTNSMSFVIGSKVTQTYNSNTHKYTATAQAKVDGTVHGTSDSTTSGTEAYEAGSSAGYTNAHLSSSWNSADNTLSITKVTTGNVNSISIGVAAKVTQTYNSNTHKYTATAQAKIDGAVHGSADSTISGTEAYDAGYTGAHLSSSWNAADTTLSITKVTTGSTNSMSFAIGANAGISYNSRTHKYTATAQATVDGLVHGSSDSESSGTEAYGDGYDDGYAVGYSDGYDDGSSGGGGSHSMTITRIKCYHGASGDEYLGKMYYYDATKTGYSAYVPATDSNQYWYYSNTNKSGTTKVYYD